MFIYVYCQEVLPIWQKIGTAMAALATPMATALSNSCHLTILKCASACSEKGYEKPL